MVHSLPWKDDYSSIYMIWSFHSDSTQWSLLGWSPLSVWSWHLTFHRLFMSQLSGVENERDRDSLWNVVHQLHIDRGDFSRRFHCMIVVQLVGKLKFQYCHHRSLWLLLPVLSQLKVYSKNSISVSHLIHMSCMTWASFSWFIILTILGEGSKLFNFSNLLFLSHPNILNKLL
jgi:hypothetical protein